MLPQLVAGVQRAEASVRARELLASLGLDHRFTHRPSQLSGGEQQRVAVARALISRPDVVFADEPTGNLDSLAADGIVQLLRQVADSWGRSVLMVTHDPRIAAYADRIVFLKDGTIVEETRLAPPSAPALAGHSSVMEAR